MTSEPKAPLLSSVSKDSGCPSSYSSSASSTPGEGTDCSAFDLASFVVKESLSEAGLTWWDCPELPADPEPYFQVLACLCREFRASSGVGTAAELLDSLPADDHNPYPIFAAVVEKMAPSGSALSWGRLVGVAALSGELAVECERRGQRDQVGRLASYLGLFLDAQRDEWILKEGGWASLVTWASRRASSPLFPLAVGAALLGGVLLWRSVSVHS